MTNQDRDRFEVMLLGLAEIFDKQLSERQIDLYYLALEDMDIEDVVQAGNILARSVKFFPKPVEFRESMAINTDDMASIAYGKFHKGMMRAHPGRTLIFDDPIIHAVIENIGGWNEELYNKWSSIKDEVWLRKQFESLYQTYAKCGVPANTPERLVGGYEAHNEGRWDINNKPILVGSKNSPVLQKALAEYKQKALAESTEED